MRLKHLPVAVSLCIISIIYYLIAVLLYIMIILPEFSLFMHPWYTMLFLKSTAIYKEQLSMKKKYLACQRQNILHPVLWLECQRHSLAITEMNIRLCFPSILLLDALWHWAVDIQKIVDLLLKTREKSTTYMNVKKQNKKTPKQNISITLAVCSGWFKNSAAYFLMAIQAVFCYLLSFTMEDLIF